MNTSESVWQKFEQTLARRERIRLMIFGRIKTNTKPNVLVKDHEGNWFLPSLKAE